MRTYEIPLVPGPTSVPKEVLEAYACDYGSADLEDEFFDPRDLVQTKYEMLRRARVEKKAVTEATKTFGFSRPVYYEAKKRLEREGLPGLVARKRGPQGGHKLTEEVVRFLEEVIGEEGRLPSKVLAERVKDRFGIEVHPRSIERALDRRGRKPR